ncbi:hypothetical protein B7R21_03770 [Subtercola boreus]|uniref:Uncharacterized protein n=1 Tax=Subtercola boreus TaxID=120213 RepID=A0A3E0VZI6_9MICO|nr:nucleotidyltransferase family protein [Subtercola boreus]RFA15161.1 hypothetical protein B7R21_03770 [Subtercola boreus]
MHPDEIPRTTLTQSDAVAVGSAWITDRARQMGVRVLLLKGPGAAHLELRAPKVSSDIDVLVEPGGVDALRAAAEKSGWVSRFTPESPHLLEPHSVTLYHPDWPIDLDLHTYWPGFLADRNEVFEQLWNGRVEWSLAGIAVDLPGLAPSALILALHALRRPRKERRPGDLQALIEATRALFPGADASALVECARQLGALDTARPLLTALDPAAPHDGSHPEALRRWRLNAGTAGYTEAWLLALGSAPWRAKAGILLRAVVPSEREMRGLHPDIPPGRRALARARRRRLAHGLREIPRAAKSFARALR